MRELRSVFDQVSKRIDLDFVGGEEGKIRAIDWRSIVLRDNTSEVERDSLKQIPTYALTTHYHAGKWSKHTSVVLPLNGLVNNNLGPSVVTGVAARYLKREKCFFHFKDDETTPLLEALDYSGPVSCLMNSEHECVLLVSGVPWGGLFPLLQTLRKESGGVEKYVENPASAAFHETWTVGLVLSRFPFPNPSLDGKPTKISIDSSLKDYFLPSFQVTKQHGGDNEFIHVSTLLGLCLGWHSSRLSLACQYAELTASKIVVKDKMYRTDGYERFSEQWNKIREVYT